ncbi:FG-GAP repeat domain-containing protein [Algoriphagus sediminis]|uniref:VCBS repeat-containing protein n=1 Tax=Algoriphagus sediminis TaxID=3057113 RepID=A0ABT7Y8V9_9BACT|nr:VCBS repeat-containing protein [Algoriphagus sediminis]MDN3202957.1 VCBS repeat-containing protein [Algoriphagus sediminis]
MKINLSIIFLFVSTVGFSQSHNLKFEKQMIGFESFESVGIFDVNQDGFNDLVSGSFWYVGPEFTNRKSIGEVKRYGEYYEDFATIPMDVNGDSYEDYITGGWFDGQLIWKQNPGSDGLWDSFLIAEIENIETIRAWDIDKDGVLEIVPNNPKKPLVYFKLVGPGQFKKFDVYPTQGHGLGFGDINGDGNGDLISSNGWYEASSELINKEWVFHPLDGFKDLSIPIIVTDLTKDGKNDLIIGNGHDYGLFWMEQVDRNGQIGFERHEIDPYHSQYHTMEWVDLDGDGQNELITGKRYRAHNGRDPGGKDEIGLYYFKWDGKAFYKNVISYGPLGKGKGAGIYFEIKDLNQDGKLDIAVAGKDGLAIFWQR